LWVTVSAEYSLDLSSALYEKMYRECQLSGNIETGGILTGYYTFDRSTAVVTDVVPPPVDSQRGPCWFNRGVVGLRSLLSKRWEDLHPTYYIGEWHYHPSRIVLVSETDLNGMRAISTNPSYHCREPVMVIIGQEGHITPNIKAYVFPQEGASLEFHQEEEPVNRI